jgi:hypothetical protein
LHQIWLYIHQHIRLYRLDFVPPYFKGISANIELQVYISRLKCCWPLISYLLGLFNLYMCYILWSTNSPIVYIFNCFPIMMMNRLVSRLDFISNNLSFYYIEVFVLTEVRNKRTIPVYPQLRHFSGILFTSRQHDYSSINTSGDKYGWGKLFLYFLEFLQSICNIITDKGFVYWQYTMWCVEFMTWGSQIMLKFCS